MKNIIINQEDYTLYQPAFLYDWSISFEEIQKNDISHTVLEIVERINIKNVINLEKYDSRSYDPVAMFKIIALGAALYGNPSLRDYEDYCRYDMRFRAISNNITPCYRTIGRFIESLKMSISDLNKYIYLYIQDKEALEKSILYIDGTKFEANANKMTFFWSAWIKKHFPKNWQKCMECIRQINNYFKNNGMDVKYSILKKPDIGYLIEIDEALDNWLTSIQAVRKGRGLHPIEKMRRDLQKAALKLWEYMIAKDLLDERNSFSKTDPDATFMHMKYDYYNHTNIFKPGYNVQIGVNNGYIAHTYVSSDANDIKTYIPFMESYKKIYGRYPDEAITDAGYGSLLNYIYSEKHGIKGYLKYSGFDAKKEKVTDKNRFRSVHFKRNEKGIPVCPKGYEFTVESCKVSEVEGMPKTTIYYRNEHCSDCPFRNKCTKSKEGRTIQVTPLLERYQQNIDEYFASEEGQKKLANRSSQAEGAFADIKQNFGFTRLRRKGKDSVELEVGLVVMGHNIRAYHNRKQKLS